jgi:hypothetical protein
MNDSEKILKAIEALGNRFGGLENRFGGLENRFGGLESEVAHSNTALEALAAGQKDIRDHMATKEETASKADILDLKSDLTKKVKNHEKRITEIEDELDIPHPNKN